ncbi:MAG: LysR substrate-binding domain-containing protein [Polyangiaceae bacterium]|jgi:DNA-binding transcriptional LysR family regulator
MRDLNDLQFFVAVVGHRSFSQAARVLGVPKSRVSRRVALLEEHLGVRLLERSTRSLNVTEVGQQIYEHARAAIEEADAVEDVALRMRSEPRGLVRISCPHGLQDLISQPLPAFLAANPSLRVQVIMTNRRVDLIEEGVDIAIRIRERLDTDADVQLKKLGTSKRILVAAPQLLAEVGGPTAPADLMRFPLLHQQELPGPSAWTLMSRAGQKETIAFQPRLATGDFGLLVGAACAGIGIALLPRANCSAELVSGRLVQVLAPWGVPDGIVHLVFTSRRGMLPGVRAFVEFAADALRAATS